MRWLAASLFLVACHRPDAKQDAPKSAGSVDVLFVGNSYTYVNDLPTMTRQLLASASPPVALKTEAVTIGGASLHELWDKTDAQARIAAGHYRFVVIQGQSVEACTARDEYVAYAHRFADLALAHGATPVLYATWPRRTGNEFYRAATHPHTPEEMASCLRAGVTAAAAGTTMKIANVRDPWFATTAERPELELYEMDGSHPLPAGTFLAANVLGHVFSPGTTATWRPEGVAEADATYLVKMANRTW